MTNFLTQLEDLNPTPTNPRTAKLHAALLKAGIRCEDLKDDGWRIIALADTDGYWSAWFALNYAQIDAESVDEIVADLWKWREDVIEARNKPIVLPND